MVLFSEAESEEWFAWKLNSSQMAEFLPFSLARGQFSHPTPGSCHQHVIEGNGGWQRWSWVTEPISCQMWRHLIWHICHEGWWELSGSSAICRLMSRNALEEEWGWKRRGRGGWMGTRGGEAGAVVSTLSTLCQHYQHRALCTVQCTMYPDNLRNIVQQRATLSLSSSSMSRRTQLCQHYQHRNENTGEAIHQPPKTDRRQIQL